MPFKIDTILKAIQQFDVVMEPPEMNLIIFLPLIDKEHFSRVPQNRLFIFHFFFSLLLNC